MKIIVTGSLGHIGKPLTIELVEKGHSVTVISSRQDKQMEIETLGAIAAIGSLEDVDFLATTFTGAEAVYSMIPPNDYFDPNLNLMDFYRRVGNNYVQAIQRSSIKRVVHLSSIGAHLDKDTGLILAHRDVELMLSNLSNDIAITFMRPTAFYYNLFGFLPVIKNTGKISSNYGASDKIVWVSPEDIAADIANEIVTPIVGRKIRYVASEELTCNEVANILGAAIGKPDLEWILISNDQMKSRLETIGMNSQLAAGLVEMQSNMHDGEFFEDYYINRPALGKVKLAEFAKEFAIEFKQK